MRHADPALGLDMKMLKTTTTPHPGPRLCLLHTEPEPPLNSHNRRQIPETVATGVHLFPPGRRIQRHWGVWACYSQEFCRLGEQVCQGA